MYHVLICFSVFVDAILLIVFWSFFLSIFFQGTVSSLALLEIFLILQIERILVAELIKIKSSVKNPIIQCNYICNFHLRICQR